MVVVKLVKERIKMLSLIYVTSVILGSFIKVSEVGGTNQIGTDVFTTKGYGYQNFFPTGKQENDGFKLEFNVIAPRDGHILLSPEQSPTWESPVYEIVLGAVENTFSVIRRKKLGGNQVVTYSAESLVSPDEWREFWIKMKGNKIQVGRKYSCPFMEWEDPEPLPIKYYSFGCYNDALASWIIISSPSASAEKPGTKDLCILSPCGPNSECRQIDDYVTCSCKENYTGSPPQCRPECTADFECPENKACTEQKCQDPCVTACGQNAQCLLANHTPICSCLPGFTGNASVECVKEQQPPKNLCILSPCGPNSECRQMGEYVACSCKENYIGSPPQCRPECTTDFECPENKACSQQKCQDPCVTACGQNAQCLVANHTPVCSCSPGFTGNAKAECVKEQLKPEPPKNLCILSTCGPNSECRQIDDYVTCSCKENYTGSPPQCRPECINDFECPQNKACTEKKCQDPCVTACGQNEQCLVANHTPICSCLPGFTVNASVECVEEQQPPKNLCILSPCGPNSECRQIDNYVTCSCKENYTGSPPQCRPECTTDFECPQNKACIGQKCQDVCVAACGINAQCLVANHTSTCECLNGFIGDPLVKCVEEGQPDENCRNIWITHDYKYEHFFPITKRDNNSIELNFKVKANRDANMVFTQNMYPIHGDPAYEVVLGDRNNTRSVIRRTRYHPNAVTTIEETALVSPNEWLEFWVKIEANAVEVGRKGKRAFMVLKDVKEMPIKYYSIAGWGNATVLWSLPCVDEKDFS